MSEQLTLPAETRDRAGKGASRELRNSGRVPAVVYGANQEPLSIHVEEKLLAKMLSTGHFMNSVVMIDAGGKTTRTLPKDVQFHPVSSRPVHVDFLRIGEHSKVTVSVPVRFVDEEESPGIKRGAVLNIVFAAPRGQRLDTPERKAAIDKAIAQAATALDLLLAGDMARAMMTIHARPPRPKPPRPTPPPIASEPEETTP